MRTRSGGVSIPPSPTLCVEGSKKCGSFQLPTASKNKFADLWFDSDPFGTAASAREPSSLYYKSKLTIHDAIKSGLPLNAAELQAGLKDPDGWSQEYLCEFMDSSSVLFPYDLIAPCESEQATETGSLIQAPSSGQFFAGIDFGRKHHLTVCWILERLPGTACTLPASSPHLFVTREVLTMRNTSTPEQLEILRPRLQRCRKICLDYTGAGVGLGDYVVNQFGAAKVELCQFTPALKAELFPRLRVAFEQRNLRIPISRDIREDLHGIQRSVSQFGQISYRAPQSPDGHSDRTTALSLALRAATSAPPSGGATTIWVPGRTADLRWMPRRRRSQRPFWH